MQVIPDFNYIPSATGFAFHNSDAFLKLVCGPYGSGKTCMIMNDAKYYCLSQAPASDGVRYTRIGVVRGTYPELISTTRNSILEVFPKEFGTIKQAGAPLTGKYRFPVGDGPYDYLANGEPWREGYGTIAEVEFVLQALQAPSEAEKVKSANWTFAIVNEATSVAYEIINAIMGRVGRYPTEDKGGCTYAGVLIDTNQPPQGHYLINMMNNPEPNWEIFHQPPAAFKHVDSAGNVSYELNQNAENLRNLGAKAKPDDFAEWSQEEQEKFLHDKGLDYYNNQIKAWQLQKREDVVDSLFCMLDVPMRDGKPVFSSFQLDAHVSQTELEPIPYKGVVIGYDTSGVHPACLFMQEQHGSWVVLDELYGEDLGMEAFLEQALLPLIAAKYSSCPLVASLDPANAKDSYTGLSPSQHIEDRGISVYMPKTNDPKTRIAAVENLLNKRIGGLLIDKRCTLLIQAMQGGYRYKRLRVLGSVEDVYDPKPEKNNHSHIADALQYACLCVLRDNAVLSKDISPMTRKLRTRRRVLARIM